MDVALNEAFARALRDSGKVRHLAFMTAAGADPTASASGSGAAGMARYNRVKGEAEVAVRASGPAIVSVFRPAMIIGSPAPLDSSTTPRLRQESRRSKRRSHSVMCSGVSGPRLRNSKGVAFSYRAMSAFWVYEENG